MFPEGSSILSAAGHGGSLWTRSIRIDIELADGTPKAYFIKVELCINFTSLLNKAADSSGQVATGENCLSMLKGEYNSSVAMDTVLPGFAPLPIGWGTFESNKNLHFFLQAFHEMDQEVPDMDMLTKMLAEMHLKSAGMCDELTKNHGKPAGTMYGFHVTTHHGKLAQDTTWTATWEEYFVRNMRCMLDHDEKEGGPRPPEMEELLSPLFRKVIPRLLRPMEIEGRHVKPCLIHGDLWDGNCSTDTEKDRPIVYDACCFWGHNECESFPTTTVSRRVAYNYLTCFTYYHFLFLPRHPNTGALSHSFFEVRNGIGAALRSDFLNG